MDITQGWKPATSNHDHHRGKYKGAIGSSMLKTFITKSAAHMKYERDHPKPATKAFLFGDQFHRYALKYDVGDLVVVPKVDKRTKKGKLKAAELEKKYADKIMVSQPDYDNMMGMVNALKIHPLTRRLLTVPDRELTGIWFDVNNRLICKIRPDLIDHEKRIIVDLKSCQCAAYVDANKDLFKFLYHISAAWYRWGAKMITGHDYAFIDAFVEKTPPYGVCTINITGLAIRKAWDKIGDCLGDLADCVQDDKWPNYEPKLWEPDVPGWVI